MKEELEKTTNGETVLPIDVAEETELKGYGYRHQQCLILLCCLTTGYSMRVCMSVSLVAMTGHDSHSTTLDEHVTNNCTILTNLNDTNCNINKNTGSIHQESDVSGLLIVPPYPKFNWDKKTQDTIQSSFFWGYTILQLPAGQLLHHFGARYLLTTALLLNCVVSILLPWAAFYGGWMLILVCRITQGLGQAFILPGIHTVLGKWAPLEERGRMSAFVFGGQAIGTVVGLPITGFIASSPLGWPGIFRFYGILSGIVGGLIWWIIADTPATHRNISAAERRYIEEKLGHMNKKKRPVPWRKILRCRGMYANVIAHIGSTWGQTTLFTEVPAFMDKVMGVNIKANGLLSALPFLVMAFTNFIFSIFTDMIIVKKYLSVTNTRKLANSLGCVPPAIGLIALAYAPRNIYIVELILIGICSFKTATHVGFFVNHIDISPNYSGTLLSIGNFVSNLFGSLAPILAGFILTDVSDVLLWRKVYFVASGMYFFTNLLYVILGTSDRADWDDPEEKIVEDIIEEESKKPMLENNST